MSGKSGVPDRHPIWPYMADSVRHALYVRLEMPNQPEMERYLADLLVRFIHRDMIYGLRDDAGNPIERVSEMVEEGDVRLKASSFEREREVHKHLGDFLLFWSGVFPEFLPAIRRAGTEDAMLNVAAQARESYFVASTFDYPPFDEEAPLLSRLSRQFEAYQEGLRIVRATFEGLDGPWRSGFSA